jgi:outer membrane protein
MLHTSQLARAVVLAACVAVTGPVRASEPAVKVMSLEQALAYAREHQPRVRVALAQLARRQAASEVPRSQWLPVLAASAQLFAATANNTTGTYVTTGFDVPRIGATRATGSGGLRPYASTFASAGARQELFDFGRIAAQAAAQDALADVEQQRVRAVALDVTFDVEEAYFAVLAAKSVVKASEEAFDRSRAHRDLAQAGVLAGLRPPIDLTRAEADLARFDIGRIRAQGGLAVAQTTFAAAVGLDDAALDADATTPTAADLPALAAAIRQASARSPSLLAALNQLRADEAHTRAVAAELRPDLGLTGTISARAGGAPPSGNGALADGDGWLPRVPNWDLGVVLSWPLFDGTVRAREAEARAQAQTSRTEITLLRQQEVAQIRLAYGSVLVARSALPGLARSVDAALANYAQADARFRAGLGTSVELADAEAVRMDAEIQLALGQFELARARAAFGRVTAEAA